MSDQRFYFSVAVAAAAACFGCITSCIARGAWIETPRGRRRIEDLRLGDEVWSVDPETGQRHRSRITHIKRSRRECVRLHLPDGRALTLTHDHPVFDPDTMRWRPAGDWVEGRARRLWVLDERGQRHERVVPARIESGVGAFEVFDLTVDHQLHNYVAHGVLVHNKSPAFENNFESVNPCDGTLDPSLLGDTPSRVAARGLARYELTQRVSTVQTCEDIPVVAELGSNGQTLEVWSDDSSPREGMRMGLALQNGTRRIVEIDFVEVERVHFGDPSIGGELVRQTEDVRAGDTIRLVEQLLGPNGEALALSELAPSATPYWRIDPSDAARARPEAGLPRTLAFEILEDDQDIELVGPGGEVLHTFKVAEADTTDSDSAPVREGELEPGRGVEADEGPFVGSWHCGGDPGALGFPTGQPDTLAQWGRYQVTHASPVGEGAGTLEDPASLEGALANGASDQLIVLAPGNYRLAAPEGVRAERFARLALVAACPDQTALELTREQSLRIYDAEQFILSGIRIRREGLMDASPEPGDPAEALVEIDGVSASALLNVELHGVGGETAGTGLRVRNTRATTSRVLVHSAHLRGLRRGVELHGESHAVLHHIALDTIGELGVGLYGEGEGARRWRTAAYLNRVRSRGRGEQVETPRAALHAERALAIVHDSSIQGWANAPQGATISLEESLLLARDLRLEHSPGAAVSGENARAWLRDSQLRDNGVGVEMTRTAETSSLLAPETLDPERPYYEEIAFGQGTLQGGDFFRGELIPEIGFAPGETEVASTFEEAAQTAAYLSGLSAEQLGLEAWLDDPAGPFAPMRFDELETNMTSDEAQTFGAWTMLTLSGTQLREQRRLGVRIEGARLLIQGSEVTDTGRYEQNECESWRAHGVLLRDAPMSGLWMTAVKGSCGAGVFSMLEADRPARSIHLLHAVGATFLDNRFGGLVAINRAEPSTPEERLRLYVGESSFEDSQLVGVHTYGLEVDVLGGGFFGQRAGPTPWSQGEEVLGDGIVVERSHQVMFSGELETNARYPALFRDVAEITELLQSTEERHLEGAQYEGVGQLCMTSITDPTMAECTMPADSPSPPDGHTSLTEDLLANLEDVLPEGSDEDP